MDKESMIAAIEHFITIYDGTAIGYQVKNRLDNTSTEEGLEDLYNFIEER